MLHLHIVCYKSSRLAPLALLALTQKKNEILIYSMVYRQKPCKFSPFSWNHTSQFCIQNICLIWCRSPNQYVKFHHSKVEPAPAGTGFLQSSWKNLLASPFPLPAKQFSFCCESFIITQGSQASRFTTVHVEEQLDTSQYLALRAAALAEDSQ